MALSTSIGDPKRCGTRRAGFDAKSTEDPKSKSLRTGAGQENLTAELMDSMAGRLSAIATMMSCGLVVWTVISKGH